MELEPNPWGAITSLVIVALLTALFALVAFLLYRETHTGRLAGDHLAALAWHASQHLWSVLKALAISILVYVQMVRHGGIRDRRSSETRD